MATGDKIKLGALFVNNIKQPNPSAPWATGEKPAGTTREGNIPKYVEGTSIEIKDSPDNLINWIEVNVGDKRFLVSDRVLLTNISRDDLTKQIGQPWNRYAILNGRKYYIYNGIDGGGKNRDQYFYYKGGEKPNEWDDWIGNEINSPNLLTPTEDDIQGRNIDSSHNQMWNWFGVRTMTRNKVAGTIYDVARGGTGAKMWGTANPSPHKGNNIGWRPILEDTNIVINSNPIITENTANNNKLYEKDTINLNGSATDIDNGNIISIKYSINDGPAQIIKSSVSDGTTPISYGKTLIYTNKTIKDGQTTLVTGLADGTTYNIKVWAEDDQGGKSTIVTRNFTVVTNRPPIISGVDSNLGDKNTAFNINYMVVDNDGDTVTITEKLNNTVIRTVTNAPQNVDTAINISADTLYSLPLGVTNTIEIRAEDSKGSVSYRRHTFKRSNSAPIISGVDTDLGEKTQEFNVTFSATDVEKTALHAKVFLNDTLKEQYAIIDGQDYTYTMKRNDFLQLDTTQHNIRIEVTDADGGTAIRNFNFTKVATKLEHGIKIDTDAMASQVLVTPIYHLAEGAVLKVMVCNNVNDTGPAWEDATEQVLLGRHYNFLNSTKTDILASWGIGVKISIEKGTATEKSYLSGYGGAYK